MFLSLGSAKLVISWPSFVYISVSGLLQHNKPEMLLVVICVLLGSLC